MIAQPDNEYNRDGISMNGFNFDLSLPYCAHFSETFWGYGDQDRLLTT